MLPGGRGGEFIIVAAIALIVVGPKDLPKLLRQLGRFVGKMRGMADDFRASFEDMARQSELDDLRKEVEAMRAQNAPSVIGDVKNEIHALDSDLRTHMTLDNTRPAVMTSLPEPTVSVAADSPPVVDPQMEGLPPKAATPESVAEPAAAAKPRKPRSPKETVNKVAVETAETPEPKLAKARAPRAKKAVS